MKQSRNPSTYRPVAALTFLLALVALFALSCSSSPLSAQQRSGTGGLNPPPGVTQSEFQAAYNYANSLETVFVAIYDSVRPSVVQVMVEAPQRGGQAGRTPLENDPFFNDPFFRRFFGEPPAGGGRGNQQQRSPAQPQSLGSGFIIDASGLIVTNSHVIQNAEKVKVKLYDGRIVDGSVRGRDDQTDIALIKIDAPNLTPVRMGDSDQVRVGNLALAVGNPFGLDGTFTTGVISAIGRAGLDRSGVRFLQTDASVNQGNSGGPLINLRGEVIGINRMIVSPSGGSVGIGFAIPTNEVQNVIEQIKKTGRVVRPYLGVEIAPVPSEHQSRTSGSGVFVVGVQSGTGAWRAGVEPEDIILKVDGNAVNQPEELIRNVLVKSVGERVVLEVDRKGSLRRITVQLGERQ